LSLNYEQLQPQIQNLGERAVVRENRLNELRSRARELFTHYARDTQGLQKKVDRAADVDPTLRCARPGSDELTASYRPPALPEKVKVLAADGSQINPDPHAAIQYYLINIGGIWVALDEDHPPEPFVETHLRFEEDVYTPGGLISRGQVALERDVAEREYLGVWAESIAEQGNGGLLVTLTDGPLELWESHDYRGQRSAAFREALKRYQEALRSLHHLGTVTAGYVDKPRADYVVKLLEVASLPEDELSRVGQYRPFQGVSDIDLFAEALAPGERSSVFGIQAHSRGDYQGEIALHFFYLNVGVPGNPWLARVEVPAWVAADDEKLGRLHAVLLQQCRVMGGVGYPYLLHRAHEIAVVKREEQDLLTEMILRERRKRGVSVGQISHKKYYKDQAGRKRYRR